MNRLQAASRHSSLPQAEEETAHAGRHEGGIRARPAARDRYRNRHVARVVRTEADERPTLAMAGAGAATIRRRGNPRYDAAGPGHADLRDQYGGAGAEEGDRLQQDQFGGTRQYRAAGTYPYRGPLRGGSWMAGTGLGLRLTRALPA